MKRDRNGMVVLDRDECLRRLGRGGLGRVAVCVGALPAIFPVNYAVADNGDLVFRTAPGTKLAAAARNSVLAFEADSIDGFAHNGWSVVVVGSAHEVTEPAELEQLDRLPVTRWAPGGRPESVVRVEAALVSGRAIVHDAEAAPDQVHHPWSGPALEACPSCGSDTLETVSDGEWVNVVCMTCYSCWHVQMGWVHAVSRSTCPGCRLADLCGAAHEGAEAGPVSARRSGSS